MNNRALFLKHLAPTSDAPLALEIEKAEGIYLYDTEGKKYIDLIAGIGVTSIGHRHPAVLKAIQEQAEKYLHTLVYGEYILSPQVSLAKTLSSLLPKRLDNVYLVNSGTEATEGALKLAKRYTKRTEIIAFEKSYHGSTHGALSLMSEAYFTQAFRPLLPDIRFIKFNELNDLDFITHQTAAVIVEPVRAEIGVELPMNDYLEKLRLRCTEVGALLIIDEIQTGCGRTGSMFAFEQYKIEPDILLLAKGLGGGMPIGAFIAPREIMHTLSYQPVLGHITTFGGHPISAAAANATLNVLIEQPELIQAVKHKEALFHHYLKHKNIREIRSAGLLMAVDLGSQERVMHTIKHCIQEGLVTDWFLFNADSLRIAPPLIITDEEIKIACHIILKALDTLH